MRRLKHRELERHTQASITALSWVYEHARVVVDRANSDRYDGYGPGTTGRAPGHSDPTAQAATTQRDMRVELAINQLAQAIRQAQTAADLAYRLAQALLAIPQSEAERLARQQPNSSASCANCGTIVLNTRDDRLRSGRCEPCYRYRHDHHGNERPRTMWGPGDQSAQAL